jgi:hypothetical protein
VYSEDEMAQATNPLVGLEPPKKKDLPAPQVEHGAPISPIVDALVPTSPETPENGSNQDTEIPVLSNPPTLEETVAKQQAAMPQKQSGLQTARSSGNSVAEMRGKIKVMQERAKKQSAE